jgi:reverse gyrase
MPKIVIEIKSCKECPYFKTANSRVSSDGWGIMEDWMCTKADKKIQGGVEWHEEGKIQIPDWCPAQNET